MVFMNVVDKFFSGFESFLTPKRIFKNDFLQGDDGSDLAFGLFGKDRLDLGGANDIGFGGLGRDVLIGGADDGQLSVQATLDLGDPFAGRDLPLALLETEINPAYLSERGDFSIIAADGSGDGVNPCFFVGDVQRTADGDAIVTVLIEGVSGATGVLKPSFLTATKGDALITYRIDGLVPTDGGAVGAALNLGLDLAGGPVMLKAVFEDEAGNETRLELEIELPDNLLELPELATTLAVETFEAGDVLSGGAGGDTFVYDPDTDGVDTLVDFQIGVDQLEIAGAINPCFVPREDGTLLLFENNEGTVIEDAGIFFPGISVADLTNADLFDVLI